MPITNYEKVFETARDRFFLDSSISDQNKEYVKKFLDKYDVEGIRSSRKAIFLKHIAYLLRFTPDITVDMHHKEKVNSYFAGIKNSTVRSGKNMSLATYQTVINVSNAFIRWLNAGEKPKGFADIKNGKRAKRDLTPADMVSWEDVKKMLAATSDIQMQAIIATQAEAGLRPSEFVDLRYGDVEFNGNGIVKLSVRGTKTESSRRIRHLYRCSPYLQKWWREHPLKKKNSPLWIKMRNDWKNKQRVVTYEEYGYKAIQLRVWDIGKKAGMEKPLDFYNLRHSAIVMSKTAGLADSIAMKEFGHATTRTYSEVYGRLSDEDQRQAIEKIHGLKAEEVEQEKNAICGVCKYSNEPKSDYCQNCTHPLSAVAVETLKSQDRKKEQQLVEVKNAIKKELMREIMEEMRTGN